MHHGLGDRIKTEREKSNRSVAQMAQAAGISSSQWNRIENEEVKALPEETFIAIEKVMGVDLEVKLDG